MKKYFSRHGKDMQSLIRIRLSQHHSYTTHTKSGIGTEPYAIMHIPDRSQYQGPYNNSRVREFTIIKYHEEDENPKIFIGGNIPGKEYNLDFNHREDTIVVRITDGTGYKADDCGFIVLTIESPPEIEYSDEDSAPIIIKEELLQDYS